MELMIRIAGEAGQGVQTTGELLAGSLARLGVYVLAGQSYLSRIRGGLNWMDVRLGDAELCGLRERAEVLLALTPEALALLRAETIPGAPVFFDGDGADAEGGIGIPFSAAAKEVGGSALMANTVAVGALYTLLGYPLEALEGYLREQFARKGDEVVEANLRCARRGAELAPRHANLLAVPAPTGAPARVLSGAAAIALGAATAGVKLVSSYPMSPSTATLEELAALADRYGIVVEQAEDEIAAINMVCGATYAGVPALTTTSGGGFALMCEGVSLAGMMELPAVILIAQRPGPATGLPTRTAQSELLFALHAGHGEFARAIFAPGTLQQCIQLTRRALEQAHRYQTPVIILTDQYLQDLEQNIPAPDAELCPIDRWVQLGAGADYQRYALTENGISPRALPGGAARVVMDSDAHAPSGRLSEDLAMHLLQHDKRMRKVAGLTAEALAPEYIGPAGARTLLLAWGSSYGPCREAVERLNREGGDVALLHFAQVWPLDAAAVRPLLAGARSIISVEGNSTAQFACVLREAGLLGECAQLLRYDGLPFSADYIVEKLTR